MRPTTTLVLALCLLLSGCLEGTVAPSTEREPEILLHVTGGFAGVDYVILVDGSQGEVVGVSCVSGCDFGSGQILHGLTMDQVASLTNLFLEAGIHDLDGTDFGEECCDQLHYDLSYTDRTGSSSVQGSSEAFPSNLREAIGTVAGFAAGVFPIVVDHETNPELWPRDPVVIREVAIHGDRLDLEVSYGGGCATHHFDLVAFGGWMESFPVQIQAFLSHDGNGDMCEAWIERDLSFDLKPLRRAYEESYGVSEPGSTTVVIVLDSLGIASSMGWLPFEYVF